MATSSKNTTTSEGSSNDQSSQVVAVYRWVIKDVKEQWDLDAHYGIWITQNTSGKDHTYTARIVDKNWTATCRCVYSDATYLQALDLQDRAKKIGDKIRKAEMSRLPGGDPSQQASGASGQQSKKKESEWKITLDLPSPSEGGVRDDNGNALLRLWLIEYLDGMEGGRQVQRAFYWAKKEMPGKTLTTEKTILGKPIMALSEAERAIFKFHGILPHTPLLL